MKPITLFNFNKNSDLNNWIVVNDVVMGGVSFGNFTLNEYGNGLYTGAVSLENNGGFSSLRYRFNTINLKGYTKVILKLKGDGKTYYIRVKSTINERHSYKMSIETTHDWQHIEIILAEMFPNFRGKTLTLPNYPADTIEEFAFLVANKKAEKFQLEIDSIIFKE